MVSLPLALEPRDSARSSSFRLSVLVSGEREGHCIGISKIWQRANDTLILWLFPVALNQF